MKERDLRRGGRPLVWDETGRICQGCFKHKPLDQFKRTNAPKLIQGVTYGAICKQCKEEQRLDRALTRKPSTPGTTRKASAPRATRPRSTRSPTRPSGPNGTQRGRAGSASFAAAHAPLLVLADALTDMEDLRERTEHRARSLMVKTKGLAVEQEVRLLDLIKLFRKEEHDLTLALEAAMREHPLGSWVAGAVGVGEKQAARMIAAVGDPYWHRREDRPRSLGELWSYCGLTQDHRGVARAHRRGETANWSSEAKKRTLNVARKVVQSGVRKVEDHDVSEDYDPCRRVALTWQGQIYLDTRAKYLDAVHPYECLQCGPAGHPALTGSPLNLAHQHARAVRYVAKECILKEIWLEAQAIHEGDPL